MGPNKDDFYVQSNFSAQKFLRRHILMSIHVYKLSQLLFLKILQVAHPIKQIITIFKNCVSAFLMNLQTCNVFCMLQLCVLGLGTLCCG